MSLLLLDREMCETHPIHSKMNKTLVSKVMKKIANESEQKDL